MGDSERLADSASDRWTTRRQLLVAAAICVPILALAVVVLGSTDPTAEELSDLFDQSVAAASIVLGKPVYGTHQDLEGWHESHVGGVNCRMHRHATWELGTSDPNRAIESFEGIVNAFGKRHSMMIQPLHKDPVLDGKPRTHFVVYDGYSTWMYGGSNDEGHFALFVESGAC